MCKYLSSAMSQIEPKTSLGALVTERPSRAGLFERLEALDGTPLRLKLEERKLFPRLRTLCGDADAVGARPEGGSSQGMSATAKRRARTAWTAEPRLERNPYYH
jgi:hypothetical protein